MLIGVSTANLYPENTEDALASLLKAGIKCFEVFINTESEANPDFVSELRRQADDAGAKIRSLHPFTSGIEPYLFYSEYRRRFEDGMKIYEGIYKAASIMGADYVVMHGDRAGGILPVEKSISRFEELYDLGQAYGVTLLQENVVNYRASHIEHIRAMRQQLGGKAGFVFDLKQCVRAGLDPEDVIDAMGSTIKHVHISDNSEGESCVIPGRGSCDYRRLYKRMLEYGCSGDWIVELYNRNFKTVHDLTESIAYLRKTIVLDS